MADINFPSGPRNLLSVLQSHLSELDVPGACHAIRAVITIVAQVWDEHGQPTNWTTDEELRAHIEQVIGQRVLKFLDTIRQDPFFGPAMDNYIEKP